MKFGDGFCIGILYCILHLHCQWLTSQFSKSMLHFPPGTTLVSVGVLGCFLWNCLGLSDFYLWLRSFACKSEFWQGRTVSDTLGGWNRTRPVSQLKRKRKALCEQTLIGEHTKHTFQNSSSTFDCIYVIVCTFTKTYNFIPLENGHEVHTDQFPNMLYHLEPQCQPIYCFVQESWINNALQIPYSRQSMCVWLRM